MIKCNVNNYVITIDRLIVGKITHIIDKYNVQIKTYHNKLLIININKILQCSNNIIDLVNVGDIVNGYTVESVVIDTITSEKMILTGHWDYNTFGDGRLVSIKNRDIKCLETKEKLLNDQFNLIDNYSTQLQFI